MKTLKFGGASLKDRQSFNETLEIILAEADRKALVLSAIYGMTDFLESAIRMARQDEASISNSISEIRKRHFDLVDGCVADEKQATETKTVLDKRLQKLERLLYGIAYTEELTPKNHALILSFGERMSVILMEGILKTRSVSAQAFESDRIGIVTDDSFLNATAMLSLARENLQAKIQPLIESGVLPIITGFFGCNREGKVTLFGRNSSDYSAAVIAYGLRADCLEIWKDVDGFMSADPKIVPSAAPIDKLSYYEAAELSYFGAKILHPRTVEPLIAESIPLVIRNIYHPSLAGTEIGADEHVKQTVVKSVTYNEGIAVLKIKGAGVGYKPGVISEIGSRLSDCGVNIYSIITSQTCINLLIDRKDSEIGHRALKTLGNGIIDSIEHSDDDVVIAVVGAGLKRTPGLAAKIFNAVARKQINIEMISMGASDVATYFIVKEPHLTTAVNAIHQAFFQKS
ncbi:MAG: aspartate kinase [Candidatus Marinimicrobia bacterium]|nr:aspartate kinase [Candidatus Neomarinimicrobiota bacterium]